MRLLRSRLALATLLFQFSAALRATVIDDIVGQVSERHPDRRKKT